MPDNVDHPAHYGGDTTYECIKVLEAWNWEMAYHFCIGNTVKYYSRLGKKGSIVENLKKAGWYATKAVEIWERHNGTGGANGGELKVTVKHHAGSPAQFPLPHVGSGGHGFVNWAQVPEVRGPINDSLNRRAG